MRVGIFFDGKNFHAGYREASGLEGARLDFPRLGAWLVDRAGGTDLWGAHYYTGVERGEEALTAGQQGLAKFLQMLEVQPGYFVHRFPRKVLRKPCPNCGHETAFSHEKEVDTTMVADMVRLAAVDGFDVLVLVSGDADLAPAVENVRDLGKKVFVATWGRTSLAARLRQASFDHIDLRDGIDSFRVAPPADALDERESVVAAADLPVPVPAHGAQPAGSADAPVGAATPAAEPIVVVDAATAAQAAMLEELARAERKFSGGYVGVSYFLRSWRSNLLDPNPEVRQRLLDGLVAAARVEIYDAPDGSKAVRRISAVRPGEGA